MPQTPEPEHLSNHHHSTLRQLFQHPVSHNIEWAAVVSLLKSVGSVTEPPHGQDIDNQAVVSLRRMLGRAGYGLESGRDGSAR